MTVVAVGAHQVACGRIDGPALTGLIAGRKFDVLYTDPPWGDSAMRMFATLAKKKGAEPPPQMTFAELVARLMQIIRMNVSRVAFIEVGTKQVDEITAALKVRDIGRCHTFAATYKMGGQVRPCAVIAAFKPGVPFIELPQPLTGGAQMVQNILQVAVPPGGTVIDPCCGLGYTARAALKLGLTFYGNEYSKARLDRTVGFLAKG